MSRGFAAAGWLAAAAAWVRLHRFLELVADAEHELRGPATVLGLGCERMRGEPGGGPYAALLDAQLARMWSGLDDLAAARRSRRAQGRAASHRLEALVSGVAAGWHPALDWGAGSARVVADRGRLAQALGNLVANAAEHGDGRVEVRGRRLEGAVRVEVRNRAAAAGRARPGPGRGRGLRIARSAARAAGGRLEFASSEGEVVAALELPLEERARADAA